MAFLFEICKSDSVNVIHRSCAIYSCSCVCYVPHSHINTLIWNGNTPNLSFFQSTIYRARFPFCIAFQNQISYNVIKWIRKRIVNIDTHGWNCSRLLDKLAKFERLEETRFEIYASILVSLLSTFSEEIWDSYWFYYIYMPLLKSTVPHLSI